jgi:DivIVA domain-containing protein
MRRKKGTDDAPATGARITPEEVQQVEFRLAFRGYNERDVDAFLDRITEGLSSYLEELERFRLVAGQPLQAGSTGDAAAVVARARAEADEIVRRAHEQASGIRAGAGPGDARGAVAPFLNQEREFLQGLGGLVQSHAEEIKQMVLAIRERAEASSVPDAARSAATPSSVADVPPPVETDATGERATASSASQVPPADLEPASAAEIRERLQASEPPVQIGPADEDDLPPKAAAPIVVESGTEPVFSTEGAPATERRERSLRELFWGED